MQTIRITDSESSAKSRDMMAACGVNNTLSLIQTVRDFTLAVNMGQIPGYSTQDKFGENPDIDTGTDPEDIWEGEGLYPWSTSADIVSLSSSDNSDTQDILVLGLDATGAEVEQTITLTGQTRVALTTPLWRVYRMSNEADDGGDLAGTAYCYSGTTATGGVPSGGSVIKALIDNGNNQTLMAIYTVPLGKVGFLHKGEVGMSRAQTAGFARCAYYSRRYGKVFQVKKRVDLTNAGSSVFQDTRSFPDIIPALTDIRLTCEEVSANNTGVFGAFDILLADESELSDAFLTAIGQPTSV